ncbi:MAG: zinc-ribbon domain-containing protein [Sandaracinus sp.]
MDVTCERCGTEYEFDETLVSDRGTTVKCTNCGHLFKVFRPGSEPAAAPPEQRSWTLELADGSTQQIASLKELQRLITAGEVSADDRISRAGEGQKRLGDIAELATFFAAARPKSARPPARAPAAPPSPPAPAPARAPAAPPGRKGTMLGMGQTPQRERVDPTGRTMEMETRAASPRSMPPPTAPAETIRNVAPPPAVEAPPAPAPPRRAASVRPPPTREAAYAPPAPPPAPVAAPPAPEPEDPRATSSQRIARPESARPQRGEPTDRVPRPKAAERQALRVDDDDDDVPPPPQRSYTGVFLGIVLLAAVGVGGYFGWPTIQRLLAGTPAESPAAQFLTQGDEALARDREDAYEDAASFYTKALALDEHDARTLTGLSRAHALRAQARLFQADDLVARSAGDPTAAGEASALRREAASDAEDAREHAESAIRVADGADAEVALADALRLSGDANAQSRLDRALTLATSPSAEALRVRALLEAQRGGGLAAAVETAERAVAEDPSLLRARLLLARAQLAAGNVGAARAQVMAVLDRDAEHPDALALRTQIDAMGGVVVDAGVAVPVPLPPSSVAIPPPPSATSVEVPPTEEHHDATAPPPEGGGGGGGGGAPHGDYASLVHQADQQLENDHPERARPLYEAALRQRPGGSEALTGLGFVLLDAGQASAALANFRQASAAGYGHAFIGLGSAYRQMHDYDHALEAYEGYLQRLPSGPEASIARRQAELLRAQGAHSGGSSSAPSHEEAPPPTESDTPVTHESTLPGPRGTSEPPPSDVPALDSEP